MKKLELKHLAPYLPYKLKFTDVVGIADCTLTTVNICVFDYIYYRPLLYPMSMVLKKIKDDKGREFIPASILWSVDVSEEERFELYGEVPQYWKDCIKIDIKSHDVRTYEHLLSWHFDVFKLIENGLALDKSKYENNN